MEKLEWRGVRVGTFIETTQLTIRSLSTGTGNIKIMAEKMLAAEKRPHPFHNMTERETKQEGKKMHNGR